MVLLMDALRVSIIKSMNIVKIKFVVFFIILFMLSSTKSVYPYTKTTHFELEPVFIEIVNADWLMGRIIVEEAMKEAKAASFRKVEFITYLTDCKDLVNDPNTSLRAETLLRRFNTEGVPLVLVNGNFFFEGIGCYDYGDSYDSRKACYKYKLLNKISTSKTEDNFQINSSHINLIDQETFQIEFELEALRDFKKEESDWIEQSIILVAESIPSKSNPKSSHKNVMLQYISSTKSDDKQSKYGSMEYLSSNTIRRNDLLTITTKPFKINNSLSKHWKVIILLENGNSYETLFVASIDIQ